MKRTALPFLLIALGAQLAGCTSIGESVRDMRNGRRASIPQSVLGSVPCVTRASEIAFGVPVETGTAYTTTRSTNSVSYLGPTADLTLYPAGKPESGARPAERVYIGLWPLDADTTEARFNVEAPPERKAALEQKVVTALEQCGATVK